MGKLRSVGACEADLLEQAGDARFERACGSTLAAATGAERLGDDVGDAPARVQARVRILKDHLHVSARGGIGGVGVDAAPGVTDLAAGWAVQADDESSDRRLAATGLTDQPERFALGDGEAHAVHCL